MFKRLVRRNLVALMIPVIIIELMVLYMSMQLSLLDEYRCYKVSDLSSVGILYKEGEQNITFDYSGDIHPAGFDYVRDGEVVGSYYYSFHGNGIQLFVLNDDTYKSISSGEKVTINARLMQDEAVTGYVLSEYAKSVELSEDVFDGCLVLEEREIDVPLLFEHEGVLLETADFLVPLNQFENVVCDLTEGVVEFRAVLASQPHDLAYILLHLPDEFEVVVVPPSHRATAVSVILHRGNEFAVAVEVSHIVHGLFGVDAILNVLEGELVPCECEFVLHSIPFCLRYKDSENSG